MNTTPQTNTAAPMHYGTPITLAQAKKVMEATEKDAASRGWPMVIAIVDSGGNLVMLHRMDQAQLASIEVARLKAETALRFRRPTKVFEDGINGGANRMLSLPVLAMEGGIPIVHEEKIIGAIGVSGMQSSQDAEVARTGLAALA